MGKKLVVVALVVALGVVVYLLTRDGGARRAATPAPADRGGATNGRLPARPRAPDAPSAGSATGSAATPFQVQRARALTTLHGELARRLTTCVPAGEAARPPRPQPLRLQLEWRAEMSTPELQRFVVREVTMVGGSAETVPPAVQSCIEQLRGTPVVMFLDGDQLPADGRELDVTLEIPVP